MTSRMLTYDTHRAAPWNTKWLASVCKCVTVTNDKSGYL
jgi:hypothetical protein